MTLSESLEFSECREAAERAGRAGGAGNAGRAGKAGNAGETSRPSGGQGGQWDEPYKHSPTARSAYRPAHAASAHSLAQTPETNARITAPGGTASSFGSSRGGRVEGRGGRERRGGDSTRTKRKKKPEASNGRFQAVLLSSRPGSGSSNRRRNRIRGSGGRNLGGAEDEDGDVFTDAHQERLDHAMTQIQDTLERLTLLDLQALVERGGGVGEGGARRRFGRE